MINSVLLQSAGGSPMNMMILLVGMFAVMYLFFIRPQQRKQKESRNYRDGLKKGDPVVTIGGIYGKIVGTEGDTYLLEVDKGMKIKIEKAAISAETTQKLHQQLEEKKS